MNKIAFLGSKEVGYSVLQFLIENTATFDIEIIAVISNDRKIYATDKSVLELASNHQVPILANANELLNIAPFDYLISVQYHEILLQKHIDCAQKLAVNLHMAPLPEYRGCNQFSFAIIEEAKEFGTTLHVLESGIDSGDLLFESRFPISNDETVVSLHRKTTEKSISLFQNSISAILTGDFERKPQKGFYNIRKKGFHLRNEIKDIKQIDLNWEDDKIDRYVRATYFPPFPSPYAMVDGKKVELSLDWQNELKNS